MGPLLWLQFFRCASSGEKWDLGSRSWKIPQFWGVLCLERERGKERVGKRERGKEREGKREWERESGKERERERERGKERVGTRERGNEREGKREENREGKRERGIEREREREREREKTITTPLFYAFLKKKGRRNRRETITTQKL